jgi:hypothetical protein
MYEKRSIFTALFNKTFQDEVKTKERLYNWLATLGTTVE